jgi:hypothetical protein
MGLLEIKPGQQPTLPGPWIRPCLQQSSYLTLIYLTLYLKHQYKTVFCTAIYTLC